MSNAVKSAEYGRGLNRIPVRFALLSFILALGCAAGQAYLFSYVFVSAPDLETIALVVVSTAALISYAAGERLSAEILALQETTDAIAAGDLDHPVEFNCACEVGGLADSFRKMVDRLNANILRTNAAAHSDPVTGLPNRTVLNHLLSLGSAKGCCGTLLFIDLDGFKAINDSLGHENGDKLLRFVSQRILHDVFGRESQDLMAFMTPSGQLRDDICPEDIVFARFAGDEFVAFVPGSRPRSKIEKMARAVLICLKRPFHVDGVEINVGASIGVARAPEDSINPQELLRFADIANFAAKQRGRNAYVLFDQTLRATTVESSEIEAELRHAIDAEVFALHFQPKLETRSLALAGVEALLRWNHPTRGMIPPGKFIPIAEKAGLMPALGKVVFDLALEQCRQWQDKGLRIPVAINVSAAQFDDPRLVQALLAGMARHGVEPTLVEIEITETMAMTDASVSAPRLCDLRAAGVSISIDDFGVGFSNLSQLAKLPVNFIKIDRSLTESIGVDHRGEAIVRATINMAHALGHATIAEGIETNAQAAFLRLAGCDEMQGFLFARPMPAAELETWMEARGRNGVAILQAQIEEAATAA